MSVALASTFSQLVLVYAEAQSPKQTATPAVVVLLTRSCGIRGHAQFRKVYVCMCVCVSQACTHVPGPGLSCLLDPTYAVRILMVLDLTLEKMLGNSLMVCFALT